MTSIWNLGHFDRPGTYAEVHDRRGTRFSSKQLHLRRGQPHPQRSSDVFWGGCLEVLRKKYLIFGQNWNILYRSFKTCQQHWGSSVRQRGMSNKIGRLGVSLWCVCFTFYMLLTFPFVYFRLYNLSIKIFVNLV